MLLWASLGSKDLQALETETEELHKSQGKHKNIMPCIENAFPYSKIIYL